MGTAAFRRQRTIVPAEADVPDLLLLAAQSGALERVRKLVDLTVTSYGQRSDAEPFGHDGITGPSPLLAAVVNGHLSVIRYFLKRYPACLNRPAHAIASTGHLLPYQKYFPPNFLGEESECAFQETLLHCACRNHRFDIAHFLLKRGADANLPSCRRTTPLHALVFLTAPNSAAASQRLLKTLLKHGANLEARDDMGLTPLLVAAQCDSVAAFLWLLEMGANRNAVDHDGYGIYHLVALHSTGQMLRYLLTSDPLSFFHESGRYFPYEIEYVPCPLYVGAVNRSGPHFVSLLKSNPSLLSLLSPQQMVNISLIDAVNRADLSTCSTVLFEHALEIREKVEGVHTLIHASYKGHTEIRSMSEWLAIPSKEEEMYYQRVLVTERCLGSYSMNLVCALRVASNRLVTKYKSFSQCERIQECLRGAQIYIKKEERLVMNQFYSCPFEFDRKFRALILFTLEDIEQKLHNYLLTNYGNELIVPECFELMIRALSVHTELLKTHHGCNDLSCPNHSKSYSKPILMLLVKWIECWANSTSIHSYEVDEKMHQLGRLLVSKHLHLANNTTLLHFVLHERYLTADVTVPLLLEWNAGVAVNSADGSGVQPLQLLIQLFNQNVCTESILQKVASHLISYGAHTDAVDSSGRRPHQVCQHRDAESLFPVPKLLPLSCLACHCIAGSDIPYKSMELPPRLKRLIAIHDSNV